MVTYSRSYLHEKYSHSSGMAVPIQPPKIWIGVVSISAWINLPDSIYITMKQTNVLKLNDSCKNFNNQYISPRILINTGMPFRILQRLRTLYTVCRRTLIFWEEKEKNDQQQSIKKCYKGEWVCLRLNKDRNGRARRVEEGAWSYRQSDGGRRKWLDSINHHQPATLPNQHTLPVVMGKGKLWAGWGEWQSEEHSGPQCTSPPSPYTDVLLIWSTKDSQQVDLLNTDEKDNCISWTAIIGGGREEGRGAT